MFMLITRQGTKTLLDKLDTVTRHTIKAGHMTQQGMVPRQATYGNQAWYQDRLLTVHNKAGHQHKLHVLSVHVHNKAGHVRQATYYNKG